MNLISSDIIDYYDKLGEDDFCRSMNMLVDRIALPIQNDVYIYTIPEYCYNIRRLTYRGRKLNPYSGQEQIWSDSTPGNYANGEPREYIYNYLGKKQIRLFPTPAETLVTNLDPWSGEGIREQMVLSFYRTPDLVNEEFRIPIWLRDQFLSSYVIKEVSKLDSTNFDTKTIAGFEEAFQQDSLDLKYIFDQLFKAIDPTIEPFTISPLRTTPGRPVLPWNFGYIVE